MPRPPHLSLSRLAIAALALILLIGAMVAFGPRDRDRDRADPPRRTPAVTIRDDGALPPDVMQSLGADRMARVLPMHQAARLAGKRFHGKLLDVTLVPPTAAEAEAGSPLVYRIRMLTRARDVLEIRMDALDGQFLDLRGADLSQVRRAPSRKDKD